MNNIPLSDASMCEVLSRVSFRLVHWWARHYEVDPLEPRPGMRDCCAWLRAEGFGMLGMWVSTYEREWSPMTPTLYTRDNLIRRSRTARTWRHVVYPQYKAGR